MIYVVMLAASIIYVLSGIPDTAASIRPDDVPVLVMRATIAICVLVAVFQVISTIKHLGLIRTIRGVGLHTRMLFRSGGPLLQLCLCLLVVAGCPFMLLVPSALAPYHALVPLMSALCCGIWLFMPPVALVLGASDQALGGLTLARVVEMFRPVKAVSLLRPERLPEHTDTGLFFWRYRTRSPAQWEEQVRDLIGMAAYIFMDARQVTPHVEREMHIFTDVKPLGVLLVIVDEDRVEPAVARFTHELLSINEVRHFFGRLSSGDRHEISFHLAVPTCLPSVVNEWLHHGPPDRPKVYTPNEDTARKLATAFQSGESALRRDPD